MSGPPDNAFWYHVAYTVAACIYAGYTVSLWWRRRQWPRRS
jgi:hypothetical protein